MVQGVSRAAVEDIIRGYVHNERDREILRMSLLDGVSYTHIADRLEPWLSPRAIQDVMNRWMPIIMEHLKR